MKAGLKQNFHFSLDSLTYFDPENCEQSYNLQAIQEPHPPCLMEPYPGGLGAPVTDEPCGWPPPPMYPAPSKVCLYLSLLSAASILGSRCHLMPPYWGPATTFVLFQSGKYTEIHKRFKQLVGAVSAAEREIWAETGVGAEGQEIHGDLNWQQFSGKWRTRLRQSITWKKKKKKDITEMYINWTWDWGGEVHVHFILIYAILDVTLASPWCASISILMNILMARRRMAFFVPFLERLHQQPLPRF